MMKIKRLLIIFCSFSIVAMSNIANTMERNGRMLSEKGKDQHGRVLVSCICEDLFNHYNKPFADIDKLVPSVNSSQPQVDFPAYVNTLNVWLKEAETKPNPFFTIIDGEAVFGESNSNLPISPTTFMVTGGVNNCVALTFWGSNPENGDYFVGLAHIARINSISTIEPLLDKFIKYPTKRITLHSGYKSAHLLEIYNYIISKGLEIESAIINQAFHSAGDDKVNITYHPQYFEKSSIDEIDSSKSLKDLVISNFIRIQAPSNIILHIPTGTLVPIDSGYIAFLSSKSSTFRNFCEQVLRRKNIPMKDPVEQIKLIELTLKDHL